jgi:hypothetical protein
MNAPAEVRCGPECYEPIFGQPPAAFGGGANVCGRNRTKCKLHEVCMPVVQSKCEFNSDADLECDYIDQCVPKGTKKNSNQHITSL